MEIGKELQSNGIGMKWLTLPIPIKDFPIYRYPLFYDKARTIKMWTDTGYNNTWKLTYEVEDTGQILK